MQAVDGLPEALVSVELLEADEQVEVRVHDNGPGIAPEHRQRIFEPNFTTKSTGMGLGLALSKNIVELLGGRIFFEAGTPTGATFVIQLPRSRENSI